MSRRYGRNQRRRHREQIANLANTLQCMNQAYAGLVRNHADELRNQGKELNAAKAAIEHAIDVLQPGHIACPPAQLSVSREQLDSQRGMEYIPPGTQYWDRDMKPTVSAHRLHQLLVEVDTSAWSDCFHAELSYCGQRVGYAMSKAAIEAMPQEKLAKHISMYIAPALARGLANVLKRPTFVE